MEARQQGEKARRQRETTGPRARHRRRENLIFANLFYFWFFLSFFLLFWGDYFFLAFCFFGVFLLLALFCFVLCYKFVFCSLFYYFVFVLNFVQSEYTICWHRPALVLFSKCRALDDFKSRPGSNHRSTVCRIRTLQPLDHRNRSVARKSHQSERKGRWEKKTRCGKIEWRSEKILWMWRGEKRDYVNVAC